MAVASTSLSASLLRDDAGTPAWCSLQAPGPLTSASPALQQLACLHREMAAALEQLAANPDATRGEPEALLALQAATGTSLAQSAAYLDAAGGDLAAAVMCWHNDVLRSFLHCYESANPLSPLSPRQAARNAAAEAMRAKAHRAAQLADTLGADIAASYLRTNFCAITKSEKPAADAALAASGGDLVAAVESFIARHALHACCCASARAPDAGGSPAAAAARAAADDASSSLSSDDEAAPPVRACNARANACPPPAASPACMPSRGRRLLLATGLVA